MFVRRTKSRQTDGAAYHTHRLVRSERDGAKVRQRTLLNLGRHFDIDRGHWPLLCQRVEQVLDGRDGLLDDVPHDVEREAQRIAAQLLARGAAAGAGPADAVQAVAVDSLALARPRSVGVEHVALWALRQLGLPALLAELGVNAALRDAALGSIVARMAFPASERATHRWLRERSAAGELLGVDFETMGAMQLYRASDALMAHREAIEAHLFDAAMGLFDLEPTVTLYDLTNTYLEGAAADLPKAARGHSKEKRSDCPLLTLGLVLDGSGFVRRSRVFAGDVREHDTLRTMLAALDAPAGALVVMDRGIATEDRVTWLREAGYRYLVVSRERKRTFDADAAVAHDTRTGRTVRLQRVAGDDGEVRLHCHSPEREAKERAIVERFGTRFEQALRELHDGLSRPRTRKRLDHVRERLGRIKAASRGAHQHYDVEVVADADGEKAVAIRWTRRPLDGSMATHPGVYCLRTNIADWDAATLWRTYTMLTDVEAVFRALKSELGLRPVHHRKPVRAEGHLFITVVAYQAVRVVRRRLAEAGERSSWTTLRNVLAGQQRVTATFRRADGRALHVRAATRAEPAQRAILDALGLDPAPGGILKTVV